MTRQQHKTKVKQAYRKAYKALDDLLREMDAYAYDFDETDADEQMQYALDDVTVMQDELHSLLNDI